MAIDITAFLGRATFITGPEKHCGKTTFMNRAFALCSRAGELPPAALTVGYDGEARDFLSGARKPAVSVRAGDIFVSAERFIRSSGTMAEILDVVPGATALGRLAIARAGRGGSVALVGPEGNSSVAWTIGRIREGKLAETVFVDGAINRITQVAGTPDSSFMYVLRVDPSNLRKSVERMERLIALTGLPVHEPPRDGSADSKSYEVDGALTAQTLATVPACAETLVVGDFTKIFLEARELAAALRERRIAVKSSVPFSGFSVACRGLAFEKFLESLPAGFPIARIVENPYQIKEELS